MMDNKLTPDLLRRLAAIVGPEDVVSDSLATLST